MIGISNFSVWGRSSLTSKQLVHYERINTMINKYRESQSSPKYPWKLPPIEKTLENKIPVQTRKPRTVPPNWDKNAREKVYQRANLSISHRKRGISQNEYIVRLNSGTWPSDDDLKTLCDGDIPPNKKHFGGSIEAIASDIKYVIVYTD